MVGRLLWLALGLGAIATAVILIEPPFLARWLADSPEEPAAAPVEFAGAAEEGSAAPADGRFSAAADSVSRSLLAYRRRHADFDGRRISCAALTAGYAHLGEHVVALALARAAIERPSPGEDAVFESAMEGAAEADRMFAAAGCPRP